MKVCATPGCPELTTGTYCAAHTFSTGHHWYRTRRWQRLRETVLRERPFCPMCAAEGKQVLGVDVHHVHQHNGIEEKFFCSPELLAAICKAHHAIETRAGR